MTYKLVDKDDPILRQKTESFDFQNPPVDPVQLYRDMANMLIEEDALGLAAPQIGLPYRFFVLRSENIMGIFNPRIVDVSEEQIYLEEGCLSFPDMILKVKRPKLIKARFTLPNGETMTEKYTGMTARCFQHETDHLDGICMINRAHKIHLEQAQKRLKKLRRKQKGINNE